MARCFIFDMDGTVFLGDRLLPGARDLIDYLGSRQIPCFFLTNNSSRGASDYTEKLNRLGLAVDRHQVFTSGEATARDLVRRFPGARVFLAGTPALAEEFHTAGLHLDNETPDVVVLGFDTTLTYDRLRRLCDFVRSGLPYIATHPDINCPTETGPIPDAGSFIALVAASTGRRPDLIIGKPNPGIVNALAAKTGLLIGRHVMVGDRLYTDIALGAAGLPTVLVFTGETKPEDLPGAAHRPDLAVADLAELLVLLKQDAADMV